MSERNMTSPRGSPGIAREGSSWSCHVLSSVLSPVQIPVIKMVQCQVGISLPLFLSPASGYRSPFWDKPIDTVSNSCLIDKKTTFGIKHLDSKPNSATYCVIWGK